MQEKDSKTDFRRLSDRIFRACRTYEAVGAIAILVGLNALLLHFDLVKGFNPDSLPSARTWVWWAAQDFKKQEAPADIGILGCSIVMHSFWFAEATHRKQPVELIVDHETTALSDAIAERAPGIHAKAFNFGLPGAMISDDCMIVRAMFNGERTPKMVILGVSPRDLMDNTFHTPAGSKHFQYLERFATSSEPDDMLVPQVWERPKFWLQKAVYLKDKSMPIQNIASSAIRGVCAPVLGQFPSSPLDAVPDEDRSLALFKNELERGFWIAQPNPPYRYLESSLDAKRKIGKPNPKMHKIQTAWLDLLLVACKDRDIDVVLFNPPISKVARDIIGEPAYQSHLKTLADVSKKWGCTLVDVNVPGRYVPTDFTDWGHMTGEGGQKTLDALADAIAANHDVLAHLKAPSRRNKCHIANLISVRAGN